MSRRLFAAALLVAASVPSFRPARAADPPPPSGAHPRLFLNAKTLPVMMANAAMKGSTTANYIANCQSIIDSGKVLMARGGADGNAWPAAAVTCAFAYAVTNQASYLTQAIKYWIASLEDDQTLGDKKGCLAGIDANWQAWNGMAPVPGVIVTVTHDTGYPIRWYGPFIALTYDWLHDAPGVSEALRGQTRVCLQSWIDYYTQKGYHRDEAGSNYNAGFVVGKTLAAIALAGENGANGDRLWSEAINDVMKKLLIGQGLAAAGDLGTPVGPMVGGDWPEGWQYGPLSVLEYAMSVRAMEENGVPLPELDAWTNSLIVRYMHATVPRKDGHLAAGDYENGARVNAAPSGGALGAVLVGPSSDQAAGWARSMMDLQKLNGDKSPYFADVLAESRVVTGQDYTAQTPPPPLWYLARGTRILYVRTGWDEDAFWGAFVSAPTIASDHHHFDASNFVFTRGGDHLIVDPSDYGCRSTLPTNAVTADSTVVKGTYAPSQTPWSKAELVWARATEPAVYAARSDFAKAFNFSSTPSDIPYAHREWVFLPEGEIVTIDRVRTGDASRNMYVNFHVNSAGTLKMDGVVAVGTVGTSQVAVHPVMLSGGTPALTKPSMDSNCYDGTCSNVRFAVDKYTLKVPGPFATAVHVIDGLAADEARATVGSITDMSYDPMHTNTGVIGAAVFRSMKQRYVVASSAEDGKAGATLDYSVPGVSSGRHIVFDAPEGDGGQSAVAATVQGDRCAISITAGAGFAGRPLMFQVSSAADGCKATENTDVMPGVPPPGGGVEGTVGPNGMPRPPGTGTGGAGIGDGNTLSGGCGCALTGAAPSLGAGLALAAMALLIGRRRRRR